MNILSYQTLENCNFKGFLLKNAPERVLQFGEGNFMRAFVDDFIDQMNEKSGFDAKVVVVQPRSPSKHSQILSKNLNRQEGLYTLYLRGCKNGKKNTVKRIISCISRCLNAVTDYSQVMACAENPDLRFITCNTTEAGIVYDPACRFDDQPANSFPGKLTQFLYRRFLHFQGQSGRGFIILACELIEDNGRELENCVLAYAKQWNLGENFITWIREENLFCSTLVDRIVTGFPTFEAEALQAENGYQDFLLDTGEIFASWVIEAPQSLKKELPFEKAKLPILVTDDHKPYKQRKVRILNGAHTSMVLGAFLSGQTIVRDCMEDPVILSYMEQTLYQEILPTLTLPREDLDSFAYSVTERFCNPFIDHSLLSISLNSTAKWKARVLPSLLGYVEKYRKLPSCLTASLAFYIAFYQSVRPGSEGWQGTLPSGASYPVSDELQVLEFFFRHQKDSEQLLVQAVCENTSFWDTDLSLIPDFTDTVARDLKQIRTQGSRSLMKKLTAKQ